jgi:hypothetical protein
MEFQIVDVDIDFVFSISRVGVRLAHDNFASTILSFRVTRYNKKIIVPFLVMCLLVLFLWIERKPLLEFFLMLFLWIEIKLL